MVKPFPIKTKVIHLINSLAHWFAKCFMSKLTRGFAIEQNLIRFMYLVLTQQRFTWLPVVDEESGENFNLLCFLHSLLCYSDIQAILLHRRCKSVMCFASSMLHHSCSNGVGRSLLLDYYLVNLAPKWDWPKPDWPGLRLLSWYKLTVQLSLTKSNIMSVFSIISDMF